MRYVKFQLLNVDFKVPEGYVKSPNERVISVESENGEISEIKLEGGVEPAIKSADGKTLSKGSKNLVSLDGSAKSISTTEKYSLNTDEITFFVKKFVDPRQVCRELKSEVEKYSNVVPNPEIEGYEVNTGDGKYHLIYVDNQCLVVITTTDIINTRNVYNTEMDTMAILQLIFGVGIVLFVLVMLLMAGYKHRMLFLIAVGGYFAHRGFSRLKKKKNECPKFNVN